MLVPIEGLHVPTSTIARDSLYSLGTQGATMPGSKGFEVGAAGGFAVRGCAISLACVAGVEHALL